MKRHLLKSIDSMLKESVLSARGDADEDTDFDMPEDDIEDIRIYAAKLRLLHFVPLSYIIADEAMLPPESIRFFCLDENWTKALVDGALSIGRATAEDSVCDKIRLETVMRSASRRLHFPRLKKMHPRHLDNALNIFRLNGKIRGSLSADEFTNRKFTVNDAVTDGLITGFIMRSELVRRAKDLNFAAYGGEALLPPLRLDDLSNDIMIGLYDGKITSLKISEPQTGLTFGLNDRETRLIPKDISDTNFGAPLDDKSININDYKNGAGRIDVTGLAAKLGQCLNTDIKSAKLAFELLTVAASAVYKEK